MRSDDPVRKIKMDGAERSMDAADESDGVLIRHRDVTEDERCERAVRVRGAMADRQQEKQFRAASLVCLSLPVALNAAPISPRIRSHRADVTKSSAAQSDRPDPSRAALLSRSRRSSVAADTAVRRER